MCDKKMVVDKIINDIRCTQSKVEGYIMKGRNNREVEFGFKQPKLEPVGKVFLQFFKGFTNETYNYLF